MFRYRLFTPMGGNAGDVELAIPTVQPGETIHVGDGRTLLVLDAALPTSCRRRALTGAC
jgi:hypothetical protein